MGGIIVRYMRSYRPQIATPQHQMSHPFDKKIKRKTDEKIKDKKTNY